jgi:hypothetical protein
MSHDKLWGMDTWVPVERRWLGLDRRSIRPGLTVLLIALVLSTLIPMIARAVPSDDVTRPGDRLNLTGGITVTPPVGWELTDGILVGADTVQPGEGNPSATVTANGIGAQLTVGSFTGNADALLNQVNETRSELRPDFTVDGGRSAVTATGGVTGVAEHYGGTSGAGLIVAYTFDDGRGLTIEVDAADDQFSAHAGEITAMVRSVAVTR